MTLPMAKKKFDADGELVEVVSRSFVAEQLRALDEWTRRLKGSTARAQGAI
jgi:hypothetical protein